MSDLIKEQLDYLRNIRQQYDQRYNPQQQQQYVESRNRLVDQAQGIVEQPRLPDLGPVDTMFNEYLSKYTPANSFNSLMQAVGNTDQLMRQRQNQSRAQGLAELGTVTGMRERQINEEDRLLRDQLLSTRTGGGALKTPSPEQLKTVYNGLRNEAAQAAKGYNFPSPLEREQWIEEYANRGVQNYLQNFATQPLGPRGVVQQELSTEPAVDSTQVTLGVPEGAGTPDLNKLTPTERQMAASLQAATGLATNQATAQQGKAQLNALRQQFPAPQPSQNAIVYGSEATKQPSPVTATLPSTANTTTATKVQPVTRNLPQEEAAKAGAKEMASAYVKDYETIQAEATAAAQQKAAFDALSKIRPNTGMFANTEQVIGSLFSALGQNPNDPTVQSAMKTRSAEQILSQLTNASLKAEKGVQTKTDEVRIYKEFPKTTDFQKVWDFSVKLGQERAQRKLDQRDFFEGVAAQNNGTPIGARRKWDQEMELDPITQYLGGQLIFRSDFLRAYERKYPDLGRGAAIQKWRELEQDYRGRGGRK